MNQVKEAVLVTQGMRREGAHPRRTLLSASSTVHTERSAWHLPASTAHLLGAALLQLRLLHGEGLLVSLQLPASGADSPPSFRQTLTAGKPNPLKLPPANGKCLTPGPSCSLALPSPMPCAGPHECGCLPLPH